MQILTLEEFKEKILPEEKKLEDQYKCPFWNKVTQKWVSQDFCEGFGRGLAKDAAFMSRHPDFKIGCKYLDYCPSYQLHVKGKETGFEEFQKVLKKMEGKKYGN